MSQIDDLALDNCGCCEPIPEPLPIYNRPGLPALSYRAGVYGTFLRRMFNKIGDYALPDGDNEGERPLAVLTTRAADDPSIALLDVSAVVADVLTFYQERIANEGYLRTATERYSVLEMAREIGYELNPGVAASTYLSFTMEDAPGSPGTVQIPVGAKVQSIPPQDKLPQIFETSETITAHRAWNALRPRLSIGQDVRDFSQQVILSGTATRLQPGDRVLLIGSDNAKKLVRVYKVEPDVANKRTTVTFCEDVSAALPFVDGISIGTVDIENTVEFSGSAVEQYIMLKSWTDKDLQTFLTINKWDEGKLNDYLVQRRASNKDSRGKVFAMRSTLAFFGHNAPLYSALPKHSGADALNYGTAWDNTWTIWKDQQQTNADYSASVAHVYLERVVKDIVPGSWVAFEVSGSDPHIYQVDATVEKSLAAFAMSGKSTGLKLKGTVTKSASFTIRNSVAHVQSEPLALVEIPKTGNLNAGADSIELDGLVLGLRVGQVVALSGQRVDAEGTAGSEALLIKEINHNAGFTTLKFETGLSYTYKRQTVTINANTVRATHGETAAQILGSGNGAQKNQRFTLLKPPLTYVSASNSRGVESTLELRVNDILWRESFSLYELGNKEQKYILRDKGDGKTEIIFGDGQKGARLPTGQNNLTAKYRSGLGRDGNVSADALSMLMTRPLGVKGVTNPFPATGGDDPETMDNARENAPLTVRTLERIVTISDYEDFTRAFAGIGKAQAVDLWSGETHLVHLTIAAADGTQVDTTSSLYENLIAAINKSRDPAQILRLDGFEKMLFNLQANVAVDKPKYIVKKVFDEISTALKEAFAFDKRAFGQMVTAAEVVALIQDVPGVISVDLDTLNLSNDPAAFNTLLPAQIARVEDGVVKKAQLLLINPIGFTLTEVQP